MRFVIVNGLPYLLADDGKVYSCKFEGTSFTLGAEVEMASVPAVTYSEVSVKAKCKDALDSINAKVQAEETDAKKGGRRKKIPEA